HNQPGNAGYACNLVDRATKGHPPSIRAGWQEHSLLTERSEDVAVARVAWRWQGHFGADIKKGEERQGEASGGPGSDHYLLRRDGNAVAFTIMLGDPFPQGGHAQCQGVA